MCYCFSVLLSQSSEHRFLILTTTRYAAGWLFLVSLSTYGRAFLHQHSSLENSPFDIHGLVHSHFYLSYSHPSFPCFGGFVYLF
ncbi:hypothetical protein GYMLUDRAFT_960966 [Collybiopsis luxurians FD-317 M1]|nr:hypothetical protein GYMLUDRAFT_960966 [Collybiopsis luxurians FD-317 M1]